MTIKQKIAIFPVILAITVLIIVAILLSGLRNLSSSVKNNYTVNVKSMEYIANLVQHFNNANSTVKSMIIGTMMGENSSWLTTKKNLVNDHFDSCVAIYQSIDNSLRASGSLSGFDIALSSYKQKLNGVLSLSMNNDSYSASEKFKAIGNELTEITDSLNGALSHASHSMITTLRTIEKESQQITLLSILLSVVFVVISTIIAIRIGKSIIVPLTNFVEIIQKLGSGNLGVRINMVTRDELGAMGNTLDSFITNLQRIIGTINTNSATLGSASRQLTQSSATIATNSLEMSRQSNLVTIAAKAATSTIDTISSSATEMSDSVSSIAAAIEEMSASFNEVARSCQVELTIANEASKQTNDTKFAMDQLGKSANSISTIVDVINDIADQTNLLALNATIEAATAGDAGKGFAVVAREVKNLALQTSQATQQIEQSIVDMQQQTQTTIKAIQSIGTVVEEITTIAHTIVTAVEEQSATINEISKNVTTTDYKTREVAKNVKKSALGLSEISASSEVVNRRALENTIDIDTIKESIDELTNLTSNLQTIVQQFK